MDGIREYKKIDDLLYHIPNTVRAIPLLDTTHCTLFAIDINTLLQFALFPFGKYPVIKSIQISEQFSWCLKCKSYLPFSLHARFHQLQSC